MRIKQMKMCGVNCLHRSFLILSRLRLFSVMIVEGRQEGAAEAHQNAAA
jgi:hypothetical protein